jgi:hypothetical protein
MIGIAIFLLACLGLFGKWALAPVYLPPPQPADSPVQRERGWARVAAYWDADDPYAYRGRHAALATA